MVRLVLAAGAAMLVATPAAAMDVATFIARANALKAKGPMALFSSDLKLLRAEGQAAGQRSRAENARARAAGKPLYCNPPGTTLGQNEVLDGLNRIPAAERKMSLEDGLIRVARAKWPCR